MADNNDFPKTFRLAKAGDNATVRFLHTSTKTIEKMMTHWMQKGDTWKHFRCVGTNCPACKVDNQAKGRMYIRLFNYNTNQVEVWDRTDNSKFFDSLCGVEAEWGSLNATAIKITRDSDDFPTYSLSPLPPSKYTVPEAPVDEKIAYRMVSNRSPEDIQTFITTGIMPPKTPRNEQPVVTEPIIMPTPIQTTSPKTAEVFSNGEDEDLPF